MYPLIHCNGIRRNTSRLLRASHIPDVLVEPLDELPLLELLDEPLDEPVIDFVRQLMQYVASSSMYLLQFKQRFECVVQQFVSPDDAI